MNFSYSDATHKNLAFLLLGCYLSCKRSPLHRHHYHQLINVPTAGAEATGLHIRKTDHNPPLRPGADWEAEAVAKAKSLTCLAKHGRARDNKFLVTLSIRLRILLNFSDRTPITQFEGHKATQNPHMN
jgi:hypothetical protein